MIVARKKTNQIFLARQNKSFHTLISYVLIQFLLLSIIYSIYWANENFEDKLLVQDSVLVRLAQKLRAWIWESAFLDFFLTCYLQNLWSWGNYLRFWYSYLESRESSDAVSWGCIRIKWDDIYKDLRKTDAE
jgi:hypothetical protein